MVLPLLLSRVEIYNIRNVAPRATGPPHDGQCDTQTCILIDSPTFFIASPWGARG